MRGREKEAEDEEEEEGLNCEKSAGGKKFNIFLI